jgi:hypothetical protein
VCGKIEERREGKIKRMKDLAVKLKEHTYTVNDMLFHFATLIVPHPYLCK